MTKWKQELVARFAGEYCCRNDQNLTLEGNTAGLTELFGYSEEEIRSVYGNSLWEMTDPDCRELLQRMLAEQLSAGDDIELVFSVRRKNGDRRWVFNRGTRFLEENGEEYLAGILVDITHSKCRYDTEQQMTRALQEQAQRDSLTQIYNAQTARELAEQYLTENQETARCALLIIDLDDFKQVNDTHGHMFGDTVLVQAARTIQKLFRSKDIIGRIGGDEFMVLMKDVSDRDIVNTRCSQLNQSLHDVLRSQLTKEPLSCSIGVAFAPDQGTTYFELFGCADRALYRAKDLGKDTYACHEE